MTSCKKEELDNDTRFRATTEVCTESHNAKTTFNGTALKWVSGDQIVVYGTAGSGIYCATPQSPATVAVFDNVSGEAGDGPFRAYYPSTLTDDGIHVTLPTVQTSVDGSLTGFPMYAESDNNQLAFQNLCGVLKLHLTKASVNVSSIEVSTNSLIPINGMYSLRYTDVPVINYVCYGTNSTVLECENPQSIADGKDFYIYLPYGNYNEMSVTITATDGTVCTKSNVAVHITRSHCTTITFSENDLDFVIPLPGDPLPGLFTINESGDQIRFSRGNLQYQASTDTWRFAVNQYDIIGHDNENISATYSGWIDLFGWGTGDNPTNTSTDYENDYQTFVDWGSNAISNGGNAANLWRTLSSHEWAYLFDNHQYGTGNINSVGGMILLPDSWTLPAGCSFTSGLADSIGDWTHNSYTLSQWEQMEAAGAVFLPAGGLREGTDTYAMASGNYWSSTTYQIHAYDVYFCSDALDTRDYEVRLYGESVRLVRDNN